MSHVPIASLDEYRLLGNSGLRVSPLCLGTMTFGNAWGFGTDDVNEARKIFTTYTSRGGNFVDTANMYQEGAAEVMLGEFMQEANNRDDLVVATKYSLKASSRDGPNYAGNSRKNFFESLQQSLKRLQTSYVDILYLHFWDFTTPTDEIMRCFDDAVRRGLIHYAGVSNVPAWRVAEMQTMAKERGYPWFIGAQYRYNLADRTVERDVLPMCRAYNIGFVPWGVLGQGKLTGKVARGMPLDEAASRRRPPEMSERDYDVVEALQALSAETGRDVPQLALNWTLHQPGVTSALVGCRTVEQLESALQALEFSLTPEQAAMLREVSRDDHPGFPHDFIGTDMWSCPWTSPGGKLHRPAASDPSR